MPAIKRRAKVDDLDDFEIDLSQIEDEAEDIEAMLGDDEDDIEQAIKETETVPTAEKTKTSRRRLTPKDLKNRRTARRAAPRARRAARRAAAKRAPSTRATRRAARRTARRAKPTATRVSVLPKGQVSLNELAEMAGITVPGMYMALKRHGYEKNPDTGRWSFTKSEAREILRTLKNAERARIGTETVGPGVMGGISHDLRKVKKAGGWGAFKSRAANRGGRSKAKPKPARAARRTARRTIARRATRRSARVTRRTVIRRRGGRRAKRK